MIFKVFEKNKKHEAGVTYLDLRGDTVSIPGIEVALVAVDEDGDEITTICVVEHDGKLCLCSAVCRGLGFRLNDEGEIITY
ncbi:MAG: hypothetical protein RBR38_10500 [Desulfomicrobium apsheronum]|nr:hypothetical protein [Desulfomicrobium apsheronum]